MSYTTTEVEEAVAKVVRTTIRRQYGALGNRRTDLTFNDTKDAAAGVFILFANAPFYVVRLAADRLAQAVTTEQNLITNFIETVQATGRDIKPVDSLSPLNNAKVALDALALATSTRTGSYENIESVPAFKRFDSNTQRFLDQNRNALVSSGDVVQTPSQARGQIGTLFSQLQTAHEDVLRRAALLEQAIDDFNALSLPNALSQSIIENSRDVLEGRIAELEALTAQQRLDVLRDVVLDILAARSAVRGFGGLSGPTTFLPIDGTGSVFADATHPATAAALSSDKYGPYNVLDASGAGINLDFLLEGDLTPTVTVQLIGSFVAKIEGTVKGPYDIGDPNGAGLKTDLIAVGLRNWSSKGAVDFVEVLFTTSATKASYEIAKEINDEVAVSAPTMPLFAEPYANFLRFTGPVDIDITPAFGTDADLIALGGSADFGALGVEAGDWVRVVDDTSANYGSGTEAFGAIFEVESLETTTTTNDTLAVIQLTSLVLVDEQGVSGGKLIEIGSESMPIRLRISERGTEPGGDYRVQALDDRVAVVFPLSTVGVPEDTQFNGLTTIGFFPQQESPSRPVPAQELAPAIRNNFAVAVNQVVRLDAQAVFSPTIGTFFGRTDPNNFLRAILYKQRDFDTDIAVTGPFTADFTMSADALATVQIGDIIVVRTHIDPDQVNNWGQVLAVAGNVISATMVTAPVADTGREVEIGPDLSSSLGPPVPLDPTLRVSGGTVNDGDYGVLNSNVVPDSIIPIEVDLDTPFPFPFGAGNLSNEFTAELGQWRVDFSSTDLTTATAITIDSVSSSNAIGLFFTSVPVSAVGTTPFFQLPEFPKALEEGDILELYTTQYNSPAFAIPIVGLESLLSLIELETPLATDTSPFVFTQNTPVPFARIRKQQFNNFTSFKTNLGTYLDLGTSQSRYFIDLQRTLNPLVVNTNPTIFQVNDPVVKLQELSTDLDTLSGFLSGYVAEPVEQVDTLIDAFTEKGADRAVVLLLEAQFSTFFGLDVDELSYAGTLQKTIRETERNDLPVRKVDRLNDNAAKDALIASYEEPDFEFDKSDVEPFDDVAIPAGEDKIDFPGQSF